MSAIFLSHSSKDNAIAAQIAAWLKEREFQPLFLDFDPEVGLPSGCNWEKEIHRHLGRCQAVIVLCSEHSVKSQWCVSEVAIADHLGKSMFPLLIAPCVPFELLKDTQITDFTANPEEAYQRLARGLQVAGLDPRTTLPWEEGRPPYPGLTAFQEEDAAVFFGREEAISEGREALQSLRRFGGKGLLMVLGASGSGKSSLVRAGLLPRLRRDPEAWLVLEPFRPRSDPFLELADSLAATFARLGQKREAKPIAAALRSQEGTALEKLEDLLDDLRRQTGQREATAVVTIDQFEELLAGPATPGAKGHPKAERFLVFLRAILAPANGRLVVIGTLRSDFLGLFQAHPDLRELPFAQLLVGSLGAGGYARIIEGPAAVAGLLMEPGLCERIVRDTETGDARTGDALPLLAYTLQQLWERQGSNDRQPTLTLASYTSLGGLVGSVQRAADGVLTARPLSGEEERALRQAFLAMTRINEQNLYSRRPALWSEMPPSSHEILRRFVTARLLVSGKESGAIEVAHESLLRTWDKLKGWLDENREFLLWRQRFDAALAEYASNHTLLRDKQLVEAERWQASTPDDSPARQLIDQSVRARKRQRRLRGALAGGAASVLAAFAGGSWLQLQAIQRAQSAQFEATHRVLLTSDPFMSVVYGLAAAQSLQDLRRPWEAAQLSQSLAAAEAANWARSAPIATGQGRVWSLIELKNGEVISGGEDGTLKRWSPVPIARVACGQIDLASIPTDTGLGPVVEAARATC